MADRQVTPPARSAKNAVTAPARKLVQRRIQLALVEARALRALVEQEVMQYSPGDGRLAGASGPLI